MRACSTPMAGPSICEMHILMDIGVQLSEIIRNIGLIAAAFVGILLAYRRVLAADRQSEAASVQADLTRRAHVAELFNRATSQLSDDKLEVRLGAIYTLRQIGSDYPDLSSPVIELLTTYLRESVEDYGDEPPPPDVREIMSTVRLWRPANDEK